MHNEYILLIILTCFYYMYLFLLLSTFIIYCDVAADVYNTCKLLKIKK